ncbi:hypothetical protein BDK51DRAFT_48422 [Blyttiomyces helicus]|uniref:Uncharacterized protein n=1 Tax=Blyttiomyces helicus TaxID=388810 RepID=A0A4P9WC16_9FUNG|nr:hypothetical protein BDK51DRAFT_48422 [Blyttiomyces helicus]|eukprot:RKO87876.1 hypothetical protein BDK51DRAFT_48422 [Blyttiomyces helicus]
MEAFSALFAAALLLIRIPLARQVGSGRSSKSQALTFAVSSLMLPTPRISISFFTPSAAEDSTTPYRKPNPHPLSPGVLALLQVGAARLPDAEVIGKILAFDSSCPRPPESDEDMHSAQDFIIHDGEVDLFLPDVAALFGLVGGEPTWDEQRLQTDAVLASFSPPTASRAACCSLTSGSAKAKGGNGAPDPGSLSRDWTWACGVFRVFGLVRNKKGQIPTAIDRISLSVRVPPASRPAGVRIRCPAG